MRSLLFVPGVDATKLAKAPACGADALILDLEDSVAPAMKAQARANVREALAGLRAPGGPRRLVRVNGIESGLIDDDLAAVMAGRPDAIVLPKATGGRDVVHLAAKLAAHEALNDIPDGTTQIVGIAPETAAAMFGLGSFAGASPRLAGLAWGAEDLATDLGAATSRSDDGTLISTCRLARDLCLAAAAAAGVPAFDTVFVDVGDLSGLAAEAEAAQRDGFAGKLAIHPRQVAPIHHAFTPRADTLAHAKRVIDAFLADPLAGALLIDGRMVDRAHLTRARQLVEGTVIARK